MPRFEDTVGGRVYATHWTPRLLRNLALLSILVLLCLFLFFGSWYRVKETERGVLTTWGAFTGVVGPGLHYKMPFAQDVILYPVGTVQSVTAQHENTYTIDNQEVDVDFTVFYRIDADQVEFVYRHAPEYEAKVLAVALDRIKRELGRVNATEVAQKRGDIIASTMTVLHDTIQPMLGIDVTDLQFQNLAFTEAYRAAINAAAVAKANVEQATQAVAKAKQAALEAQAQAEGLAHAVQAKADGDAYATTKNAEADAAKIRLIGQAQADAIKAQSDALAQNEKLIEYTKAKNWNGQLPQWVGTGPMPFMQLTPPVQQ